MNDKNFAVYLKALEDEVKSKAGLIFSSLDHMTYSMMVNCLKSNDTTAVKIAIDQLSLEKRGLAIPPLYLVSVAHPNAWLRQQAAGALSKLAPAGEPAKIVEGKEIKEAVAALVAKYGNFRA